MTNESRVPSPEHDDPAQGYFDANVRDYHALDADGVPCDLTLETEYSGPMPPETGTPLTCTCGYNQFEAALREFHPGLFFGGEARMSAPRVAANPHPVGTGSATAFDRGWRARKAGLTAHSNPYLRVTWSKAWLAGWDGAHRDEVSKAVRS